MSGKSRDQAEAEEAQWLSEHRVEVDAELDDAEEVEFEIAKPLRVTTSFRMSMEEAESIREAARNANMSQSEWIRRCALPRRGCPCRAFAGSPVAYGGTAEDDRQVADPRSTG